VTIRTMLVDDEPLVRVGLRRLLAAVPDVEIVAEAGDGGEALERLRALRPDLVFLDVRMPDLDGFEVLEALDTDALPAVVFVTAHGDYAVRAFEVHAVDYVLKPFGDDRVLEAVQRARLRLAGPASARQGLTDLLRELSAGRGYLDRVLVKDRDRVLLVPVEEVDWFEAADNYVAVHARGRAWLIRHTIKGLAARLDPKGFARIHRGIIVNLARVTQLTPTGNGEYRVALTTGASVTLSRSYKEEFERQVGWHF
jgi:two-component system LytT family response regulator